MSKTLGMIDHVTESSKEFRIYVKQSKFKRKVNKVLSYIGMRWV